MAQDRRSPVTASITAAGPLVVCATNPRYFAVNAEAVYLTGSHIWNNLHDGMGPGTDCSQMPKRMDFDAYLDFLEEHGHNFIRLWRWEHFKSQAVARRMKLATTEPRGDLSSTSYVLANPGEEYVVLQPSDTGDSFTVTVIPGAEWFSVNGRESVLAGKVTLADTAEFKPSFRTRRASCAVPEEDRLTRSGESGDLSRMCRPRFGG